MLCHNSAFFQTITKKLHRLYPLSEPLSSGLIKMCVRWLCMAGALCLRVCGVGGLNTHFPGFFCCCFFVMFRLYGLSTSFFGPIKGIPHRLSVVDLPLKGVCFKPSSDCGVRVRVGSRGCYIFHNRFRIARSHKHSLSTSKGMAGLQHPATVAPAHMGHTL